MDSKDRHSSPEHIESSVSLSSQTRETNITIDNTCNFVDLPDIDENGKLCWTDKSLKLLPKDKCSEFYKLKKQIITFDISRNSLRSVDCSLLPLENCEEIDASQNELTQLQSFLLLQSLTQLNLGDNRINSLACLNNFVNLQWLNLSHNRIESLPTLDQLCQLSTLILNSNRLRVIPNLSKLEALTELGLHGNLIRSFANIHSLLPFGTLRFLDLGGNLVSDLCEVTYLRGFITLESLTLLGNNFASPDGCKFSYRPFVYSCVLGELKILDGVCLSEGEILKGESIHTMGKTKLFRPGSHVQLCAFLSNECPLVSNELSIIGGVEEEKFRKIIQKRREYKENPQHHSTPFLTFSKRQQQPLFTSTTSPNKINITPSPRGGLITKNNINFSSSSNSPINKTNRENEVDDHQHEKQQQQKIITTKNNWRVNTIISSNKEDELVYNAYTPPAISVSSTTQITPKTTKNVEELINRSHSKQLENTNFEPILQQKKSSIGIFRSASINISPTTSSRFPINNSSKIRQVIGRNATFSHPTPSRIIKPNIVKKSENVKPPFLDKPNEKKKSKGGCFRSVLAQKLKRRSTTGPIQPQIKQQTNVVEQTRIQLLQKRIDNLEQQDEMLLKINEDNVKTIQDITGRLQQVETILSNQIKQNRTLYDLFLPTPIHLTHKKMDGTNNVLVSWENTIPILSSIDHYDVFVNDQQMGKVVARNKRLLITDRNPNEDLRISIQACFAKLNGARSQKAEIILRSATEEKGEYSSDGKENDKNSVAS